MVQKLLKYVAHHSANQAEAFVSNALPIATNNTWYALVLALIIAMFILQSKLCFMVKLTMTFLELKRKIVQFKKILDTAMVRKMPI